MPHSSIERICRQTRNYSCRSSSPAKRFMLSKVNPFINHLPRLTAKMKIKVAQFGLGPIGIETLKLAATKHWADVVGGIDIDPAKLGQDLGSLTGVKSLRGKKVYASLEQLLKYRKPDVIFHTAVSK